MRLTKPRRELARKQYGSAEDHSPDEALNPSEELFSQRYDDAPWTPHVAQPVQVLVLGHFAEEFGAEVGAHASHSLLDAFDCKHHAPQAQRVRRCDRRFDLHQFWIAKLRQLKPPVPIWGAHHNDVDLDTFEPVDAVHPLSLDRPSPSSSKPSSEKKAIAAARSSTTTLTWSSLLIVISPL